MTSIHLQDFRFNLDEKNTSEIGWLEEFKPLQTFTVNCFFFCLENSNGPFTTHNFQYRIHVSFP